MKLFVAVAALLTVAGAGKISYRGGRLAYKPQYIQSRSHYNKQSRGQSIQGIINSLALKKGNVKGLGSQGAASGYSFVAGGGPSLGGGYGYSVAHDTQIPASFVPQQFAYAPQQQFAYAPQQQVAYSPQQVDYSPEPQLESYRQGGGPLEVAPNPSYAEDLAPKISKSVYVYSAPVDPSDNIRPQIIKSFPQQQRRKHYQVVFINAPAPPLAAQHTVELPNPPELKTQIYVLVKKPQKSPPIKIIPSKVPINKPEVFFIRYKNQQQQQNGAIQDVRPSVDPQGQGYADHGGLVEAPLADLTGYPQGPLQAEYGAQGPIGQGEYGPPPEADYGPPSGNVEYERTVGESDYGSPGGEGEYVTSNGYDPSGPEGPSGYEAAPVGGGGGDAYAEYSKQYATIAGKRRRKIQSKSSFPISSRADSNNRNWKPITNNNNDRNQAARMRGI